MQQQRDVGRVLEVGLPDHPRVAVTGAAVVSGGELLDADHVGAPAGEVRSRGTAHAP